jgi:hypothetical protein
MQKLMLVLAVMVLASCGSAGDPFAGQWKLNAANSIVEDPSALPKLETWSIEFQQDGIKTSFDGVSSQGKPYHIESTGKWDGKDAPVTGDPNAEAFAIRKVDSNTMEFIVKKNPGRVPEPWRVTVSGDGKTMTSVGIVKRANGEEISGTYVYDKQ